LHNVAGGCALVTSLRQRNKSQSTNNTISNKNKAGICGLHYYELALYFVSMWAGRQNKTSPTGSKKMKIKSHIVTEEDDDDDEKKTDIYMKGHATCKKNQARNSWMKSLSWTPKTLGTCECHNHRGVSRYMFIVCIYKIVFSRVTTEYMQICTIYSFPI